MRGILSKRGVYGMGRSDLRKLHRRYGLVETFRELGTFLAFGSFTAFESFSVVGTFIEVASFTNFGSFGEVGTFCFVVYSMF